MMSIHGSTLFTFLTLTYAASCANLSLGPTVQQQTFTGLGADSAGRGQSRVTWGKCAFDGVNTNCTLSGPYSGLGSGGTFQYVLTYPGNGPSPMTAVSNSPGSNLVTYNISAGYLVMTLKPAESADPIVFYNTTNFTLFFANGSDCNPTCDVGQVGLTAGATITGFVTGSFQTAPWIRTPDGVLAATDYGGFPAISPGDWVEIYGLNLATNTLGRQWASSDFKANLAPTNLAGSSATVGGKPAFIEYAGPGQINIQAPSDVGLGIQPVVVTTAGGSSDPFNITVNTVSPGLLAPPGFKVKAGQYAVALFPDGVTYVLPAGLLKGVRTAPAKPGDIITFYGVGFGTVTPDIPAGRIVDQANMLQAPFQASFGGVPATVKFAGLVHGFLGLYQFNVQVPNVPSGDSVPFTFTLDGTKGTQSLIVPVQN